MRTPQRTSSPGSAPSSTVTTLSSTVGRPSSAVTPSSLSPVLGASRLGMSESHVLVNVLILRSTLTNFSFPDGIKVSCGAHRMGDWSNGFGAPLDSNEQRLTITEIIIHPDYDDQTLENDIAVIKVSGSFSCSPDKIWPTCLPSSEVRPETPREPDPDMMM